jgi:choline monooxygenase
MIMPTSYPDLTHFSNDPDDAWTLPGRYYYDEAVYADELELIFYQNWQYVCHISQLKTPGRYVVRDIGSQSVVILCDAHGEIRGFHNVCQHRAHRLLEGEGHVREAITCPYHAWRYDLDGRLRFARGSDKMKNFPHDSIRLQPMRVDRLCGFVFANLDADAPAMAERYDGLETEILALAPEGYFLPVISS